MTTGSLYEAHSECTNMNQISEFRQNINANFLPHKNLKLSNQSYSVVTITGSTLTATPEHDLLSLPRRGILFPGAFPCVQIFGKAGGGRITAGTGGGICSNGYIHQSNLQMPPYQVKMATQNTYLYDEIASFTIQEHIDTPINFGHYSIPYHGKA
ncbi:hypothetical protein V6N11_042378 [Hibiscus sabdariffa]|uniref:Uncharacterized protein n=1 Tax=Hibiscus sabdariffa TaxID=183260 RepID=A0ABR2QWE6_9ROSI